MHITLREGLQLTPLLEYWEFLIQHQKWDLKKKSREDFGQTLGVWGADTGCYFVLPVLGPTTARDAVGLVGNVFLIQFIK